MGRDVKIGLALGLVVIVVAIVIFSATGGGDEQPPEGGEQHASVTGAESAEPTGSGGREVDATLDPQPTDEPEGDDGSTTPPAPGSGDRGDLEGGQDAHTPPVVDPRPAPSSTEHVVVAGDTLWGLAKRYYGNGLGLSKIQEANRAKLPSTETSLRIGMKLVIPDVPAGIDASAATGAEGSTAAGSGGGGETPNVEVDTYVVRPGDTLTVIAQRAYGDGRMTARIVRANPRLARNPDRIVVGWTLRIPRLPAGDRIAARRDID